METMLDPIKSAEVAMAMNNAMADLHAQNRELRLAMKRAYDLHLCENKECAVCELSAVLAKVGR